MTFAIEWYDAAYDDLKSLDRQIAQRIGDYRVILDITSSDETIKIILVGHRSKVYQELPRRVS